LLAVELHATIINIETIDEPLIYVSLNNIDGPIINANDRIEIEDKGIYIALLHCNRLRPSNNKKIQWV